MDSKTPLLGHEHSSINASNNKNEDIGLSNEEAIRAHLMAAPPLSAPCKFPPMVVMPALWHIIVFTLLTVMVVLAVTVFEEDLKNVGITTDDILKYGSIPVVSVAFTYFHIWLALWMTFYPIEYQGILQIPGTNVGLGWQGIIPFKGEKMARTATKLMTTKLINVKEVFQKLDPAVLAQAMDTIMYNCLAETIEIVAMQEAPTVWTNLPQSVKEEIIRKAHEDHPKVMKQMLDEAAEDVEQFFDIEEMVVHHMTRDPHLLNNTFITCGYKELAFIRNSGAYMGGIFGFIQMVIWVFYQADWFLPGIGFIVGSATNWLALKIIFEPIDPINLGCYELHGLFLKRQAEIADVYADVVANSIMTSKNTLSWVLSGPASAKLVKMAQRHVQKAADESLAVPKSLISITIGDQHFLDVKQLVSQQMLNNLPKYISIEEFERIERLTHEALDMKNVLRDRMAALSSADFESLLHPVFQEDEWKLVLMGGALGVVIGLLQMKFLF